MTEWSVENRMAIFHKSYLSVEWGTVDEYVVCFVIYDDAGVEMFVEVARVEMSPYRTSLYKFEAPLAPNVVEYIMEEMKKREWPRVQEYPSVDLDLNIEL